MSSPVRLRCVASAPRWVLPILLLALAIPSLAGASDPLITHPPDVNEPVHFDLDTDGNPGDLAAEGYVEEELFFEGTAAAYVNTAPLLDDGNWEVEPSGTTAPYKVRMVVHRPADLRKFNGTVFVEWINVSAGGEFAPGWRFGRKELIRKGYAFVGVGAQWVGVENVSLVLPLTVPRGGLKFEDPVRYASLSHPGDAFSYDIFTQAGEALRSPNGPDPLGNLRPKFRRVIATGQSQGGSRLRTYINAIRPLEDVYDGFLPQASNSAAPVSQLAQASWPGAGASGTPDIPAPSPTDFREIPGVPVFLFLTESEVIGLAPSGFSYKPDGPWFRIWEVTGTSHIDAQGAGFDDPRALTPLFCGPPETTIPINAGPQSWAFYAAIRHLDRWVEWGFITPPIGDRMEVAGGAVVRDPSTGNAEGGVRLPDLQVPTRTLRGDRRSGGGGPFCSAFGETDPWNGDSDAWDGTAVDPSPTPEPDLQELYPDRATFARQFIRATNEALLHGFIVWQDWFSFFLYAFTADIGEQ